MDQLSKRAFTVGFVLFTLALLVSSATDDASKSSNTVKAVVPRKSNPGAESQQPPTNATVTNTKKPDVASQSLVRPNCTDGSNGTDCIDERSFVSKFWDKMANNRDMLFRTMYVLLGVTGIVIVYFIVRAVRYV